MFLDFGSKILIILKCDDFLMLKVDIQCVLLFVLRVFAIIVNIEIQNTVFLREFLLYFKIIYIQGSVVFNPFLKMLFIEILLRIGLSEYDLFLLSSSVSSLITGVLIILLAFLNGSTSRVYHTELATLIDQLLKLLE